MSTLWKKKWVLMATMRQLSLLRRRIRSRLRLRVRCRRRIRTALRPITRKSTWRSIGPTVISRCLRACHRLARTLLLMQMLKARVTKISLSTSLRPIQKKSQQKLWLKKSLSNSALKKRTARLKKTSTLTAKWTSKRRPRNCKRKSSLKTKRKL